MTGQILHFDAVPTNRIVLRAKLAGAHYDVFSFAAPLDVEELLEKISEDNAGHGPEYMPEMMILDTNVGGDVFAYCKAFKTHPATRNMSILMTCPELPRDAESALALAAFKAGVDDFLPRPLEDHELLARLRNLMRIRERRQELEESGRDLSQSVPYAVAATAGASIGMHESGATFEQAPASSEAIHKAAQIGRIALVGASKPRSMHRKTMIGPHLRHRIDVLDAAGLLNSGRINVQYDVVLVLMDQSDSHQQLSLISDLRSRSASRDAGLMLIAADATPKLAALALNTGANDVVSAEMPPTEISARIERLYSAKCLEDSLRARVRDGLKLASTDPLTGLHNRRFATSRLHELTEQARVSGVAFTLLMLDIDHFKSINDRFGHGVGDIVLRQLAEALKRNLRDSDLLARIGGEEFLIALPISNPDEAVGAADRLRAVAEQLKIPQLISDAAQPALGNGVTLSIGVTIGDGSQPPEVLTEQADQALYAAKSDGRNTVSISRDCAA